ncbi:type 1 glutamine amidotransferase [Paracoccus aerodenitrificans]|uniref:type 1 glutamine amidotransferase n=1 Tax=Paracoccus aerodenitrificans TaxID=3017781 RepID=UPI0022F00641|nr:type 1 glutamine amidotransferase [Paracoccus aerodenitrificans]WBU64516.1 type 1 glutamine amidotransferase [Paracoccus aerodenitrificans]
MQIGILQCGQAPEALKEQAGDYPDMFMRLLAGQGFDFRVYLVEEMQFPESVRDAEGWLLTGSRHGAYEPHLWIPPLEKFIRDAYDASVPMVGICFGHQIIAQALGGKVEKFSGGWSVGAQQYDFDGETVTLNAWHQDQVTIRPDSAVIAGSSGFCDNAALIYPGHAYTVQAHPEFNDAFVRGLIETRAKGVVPDDLLDQAISRMGGHRDSTRIADQIAAFFRAADVQREGTA